MGLDETIMVDHRIIFRVVAHVVGTVVKLSDLREICQVMEEVEVDLIKSKCEQTLSGK